MATDAFSVLFQCGDGASCDVLSMQLDRGVDKPATALIDVYLGDHVDPDAILGQPAHIAFGRSAEEHAFDGIVEGITFVATPQVNDDRGCVHRIHVTSYLGILDHDTDCQIFQDKTVREIVTEVLKNFGVDDKHQSWRLIGTYSKREYTVRYQETARAFLFRLLEQEGIYCHSEASDKGEILVFEDDSTTSPPIDGNASVPYRHGAGLGHGEDAIGLITDRQRTASGKVTLRDYNFKKPKLDLTVTASAADDTDLERYDYPGLYAEPSDGTHLAKVRLQSLQAERAVYSIEAGCPRLIPGRVVKIVDAPGSLDGEYFIKETRHRYEKGNYVVHAECVPKKVPFRLPQVTPRPIIHGPQTAVIVAPPGSKAEEIHTDEHGRCKVLFHWDRYGSRNDKASCWMRVTQAQTGGSMALPRVDWEVIVEFLEGNPDRPFVSGRVYNGREMPPYALPEGASRTSLGTSSSPGGGGRNEIRMEDKGGKEEMKVASQKDTTLATANNKTVSTANDCKKDVKVNSTTSVGANQKVQVTSGYENTVVGSQTVSVGGSRTVEVNAVYGLTSGGASTTSIGGMQFEMIGSPLQALLALAVKAATEAAQAEAQKALQSLDAQVQSKVGQVMGPINSLQAKVNDVSAGMDALGKGDISGAASAMSAASGLPSAGGFAKSMGGGQPGGSPGAGSASSTASSSSTSSGGGTMARSSGGQQGHGGGGGAGMVAGPSGGGGGGAMAAVASVAQGGSASSAFGLDALVKGAISSGSDAVGKALGLGGGAGGGQSGANTAGPDGTASGNSAADSATGPGWAVNKCASTHDETISALKATIAAAGITTTVNAAHTQKISAARVEAVAGTRADTCQAGKTEKAAGFIVMSPATESVQVGANRTTMVGGAIYEKVGASCSITATGTATLVGAYHKIDASSAIVFQCGDSSVTIDGGGITIKAPLVTITSPTIALASAVTEA